MKFPGSLRAPYGLKSRKPVRTRAGTYDFFWTLDLKNFGPVRVPPWLKVVLSDTGFLRYFTRRIHVYVRTRPARDPCGARTWPYGHHTKPVRVTRSSTVRSFKIHTGPLRPRVVWRVWKLRIEQGAHGILSLTHFPGYGIMSLSQCIIHWLNDRHYAMRSEAR